MFQLRCFGCYACFSAYVEKLLEVKLLALICNVNDSGGGKFGYPGVNGGNVGGSIIECTVTLLNYAHSLVFVGQINDYGTFAFACKTIVFQAFNDTGKRVLVITFASCNIKAYAQAFVCFVEFDSRKPDEFFPERKILGVTILQFY